eukprot:scaffold3367_cov142-Skeletonema_menzelii.AAC.3
MLLRCPQHNNNNFTVAGRERAESGARAERERKVESLPSCLVQSWSSNYLVLCGKTIEIRKMPYPLIALFTDGISTIHDHEMTMTI